MCVHVHTCVRETHTCSGEKQLATALNYQMERLMLVYEFVM